MAKLPVDLVLAGFGNTEGAEQLWRDVNKEQIPGVGTGSILGSRECIVACKSGKKVGVYDGK